ncbi:hypothetical protein H0A61_00590 [Koleobacter methoxysyntrophicus]|uniref:Uncharacterized protein n=1 Tax=Koleobacter methoxysyntrophicus TaxID=2751313 RepID=A0A8A0RKW5_9FIRM|nr:hypothetical protein [Koleobacter methoxysyntrophicus]QSQ08270.1 hypothetical protein H0A61_00590 [Koleobacter methoxysyntrophicus]
MEKKEKLKEYLMKEVEIIQEIINRMALNSFLIKGWAITLVVGTLLLKGNKNQVLIAFIPLIVFWLLDGYFLWQERMYRKLYEWVIKNRLETDEYLLDMNAYRFAKDVDSWLRTTFWKPKDRKVPTLLLLYGSVGILIIIYFLVLIFT